MKDLKLLPLFAKPGFCGVPIPPVLTSPPRFQPQELQGHGPHPAVRQAAKSSFSRESPGITGTPEV